MAITLRICRNGFADTIVAIPDGATATIGPNGDVDICVDAAYQAEDYEKSSRVRSGPKSCYKVSAATTGYGKPPSIGEFVDIFANIHDEDATDPEVRPLVRGAIVTKTTDPDHATTRCRNVDLELELTLAEIDRIRLHEHRKAFSFRPVAQESGG